MFLNGVADGTIDLTPYKTSSSDGIRQAVEKSQQPTATFSVSGIRLSQPRQGVNIVDGKKILKK
jgi:hypothetical protein